LHVVPRRDAPFLSWKKELLYFPFSYNPLRRTGSLSDQASLLKLVTFRAPVKVLKTESCLFNPYSVSSPSSLARKVGVYTFDTELNFTVNGHRVPFPSATLRRRAAEASHCAPQSSNYTFKDHSLNSVRIPIVNPRSLPILSERSRHASLSVSIYITACFARRLLLP